MKNNITVCALAVAALLSGALVQPAAAQGNDTTQQRARGHAGQRQRPPRQQEPSQQSQADRGPSVPEDTAAISTDEALAEEGGSVWRNRGCDVCHGIGQGRITGPDLAGVTQRRSASWLRNWLRNPPQMARTDSTARTLVEGYNNIVMPNLSLRDDEISALLSYIHRESNKSEGQGHKS